MVGCSNCVSTEKDKVLIEEKVRKGEKKLKQEKNLNPKFHIPLERHGTKETEFILTRSSCCCSN